MKKAFFTTAILFVAAPVLAQTTLPDPGNDEIGAPRPHGISLELAREAALAGNAACEALGAKTSTIVVDSKGVPIIMISDDGALPMSRRDVVGKAMIALRTKAPSADGDKADPAVMVGLGPAHPGGFPLMADGDVVGALAVGGSAPHDEACAEAAVAKIQARIQ